MITITESTALKLYDDRAGGHAVEYAEPGGPGVFGQLIFDSVIFIVVPDPPDTRRWRAKLPIVRRWWWK